MELIVDKPDQYVNKDGLILYLGFKIKKEDMKLVEHCEMEFFNTNGQTLFEVRDHAGNGTGDYFAYIVFKKP